MNITFHIDLHLIANIVAIALIVGLCLLWILFSRRLVGFLLLVGTSVTLLIASQQSDLTLARLERIGIIGAILTALMVVVAALIRSRMRRGHRIRTRQQQALIIAAQRESEVRARRDQRLSPVPVDLYGDEDEDEWGIPAAEPEEKELRRPGRGRYIVRPLQPLQPDRKTSKASRAKLQGE